MNTKQLSSSLQTAFDKQRLVFWYDAERSFIHELDELQLSDVTILNMEGESTFGIKLMLELEDTKNKYLLYFPFAEPEPEDDWLLDIKLYSRVFYADRISIVFNDLGLKQLSLREHLRQRDTFLANKARIEGVKRLITAEATATELDMAMIAVSIGSGQTDIVSIICELAKHLIEDSTGLEENPKVITDLEKYQLITPLLHALQGEIGYQASREELEGETAFQLGNFFIRLLTTGFCESVGEVPSWAKSLVLSSLNARATARALLSQWRYRFNDHLIYDELAKRVASALRISERLADYPIETLVEVATFEEVERYLVVDLAQAIPNVPPQELSLFQQLIAKRLDGFWASRHIDCSSRRKYRAVYTALNAAIKLFTLRQQYDEGFNYPDLSALYHAYTAELYAFDFTYRHYIAASKVAAVDLLKPLDQAVEDCYSYWYLDQLSRDWGKHIEHENSMDNWAIARIPKQQDFYKTWVKPLLEQSSNRRVVVIISDAFRYEAAVELIDRINEKRYNEATLASQLGVLPSYTSLGMASLLPHDSLTYTPEGRDTLYVDGQSTAGTEQRNKILANYQGIAVTAEQLKSWSKSEGQQHFKNQRVVYVYHNIIDDRSDKGGASELDTFAHVESAIQELAELTRKITMDLNTATVLITADHGFLFQHSALEDTDRTSIANKPANTFKHKKRYALGYDLPTSTEVWQGSTKNTADTESDTQFWIPKGANRFHFVGGARFVHGGAMPQEVVVPVITVNTKRGKAAQERTKQKVGVISPRSTIKMTSNMHRFELMQTDAVGDNYLPITIRAALYEADQPISSEETITFDSESDQMSERHQSVLLSLLGSNFDRKKDYFLILHDKDSNIELERYKVTIDLAFTDDFF